MIRGYDIPLDELTDGDEPIEEDFEALTAAEVDDTPPAQSYRPPGLSAIYCPAALHYAKQRDFIAFSPTVPLTTDNAELMRKN